MSGRELIDPEGCFWYVEARVGSANHRGECCRLIIDRRGTVTGGEQVRPSYVNESAEEYIKALWQEIRRLRLEVGECDQTSTN